MATVAEPHLPDTDADATQSAEPVESSACTPDAITDRSVA